MPWRRRRWTVRNCPGCPGRRWQCVGLVATCLLATVILFGSPHLQKTSSSWVARNWKNLPQGPSSRNCTEPLRGDAACAAMPTFSRWGRKPVGYSTLAKAFRHAGWRELPELTGRPTAAMLLIQPKKGQGILEIGAEWLAPGSVVSRIRGSNGIGGTKVEQVRCRQHLADRCTCPPGSGRPMLRMQPRQWQLQLPNECRSFFRTAAEPSEAGTEWILKPSAA